MFEGQITLHLPGAFEGCKKSIARQFVVGKHVREAAAVAEGTDCTFRLNKVVADKVELRLNRRHRRPRWIYEGAQQAVWRIQWHARSNIVQAPKLPSIYTVVIHDEIPIGVHKLAEQGGAQYLVERDQSPQLGQSGPGHVFQPALAVLRTKWLNGREERLHSI